MLEHLIDDGAGPGTLLLEIVARYVALDELDEGLSVAHARARVFEVMTEYEAEVIMRLTLAHLLAPVTIASLQLAWARGAESVEETEAAVMPAAERAITAALIERAIRLAVPEALAVYEARRDGLT